MTYANTRSLITLVESADDKGFITLQTYRDPIRSKEQARNWLLLSMMDTPLLTVRLNHVKKAINEIEPSWRELGASSALTLNLVKLLLLPAEEPAMELASFHEMLLEMKQFFIAHAADRVNIQLCNNRDRNGRVYGTLLCRQSDGEGKAKTDERATESLNARIARHPALSHWLRQVALSLQKRGPHSWCLIREDDLFGVFAGPHYEWLCKQPDTPAQSPDDDSQATMLTL